MTAHPDYAIARQEAGFNWHVGSGQDALRALTGILIRQMNLEPEAGIELYRRGRPLIREMFGEDVRLPGPATPAVSYGHANGLGSELLFPEEGEVGHTHPYESLDQALQALREPVDFAQAGMAPFYLDYKRQMADAFPDEKIGFGYGLEGPLTTAYELRGEGFFTDIFDDPAAAREFLRLLTDSIIAFHEFEADVNGVPAVSAEVGGLCDDVASMIPPHMWAEFVIPYWEQYYAGMTTGRRHAHVEDLRTSQLPFLEEIGLAFYDPSISPQLNPRLITEHCGVPYTWRLGSIHCRYMTPGDVEDFVYQAVADGASTVHCNVAGSLCDQAGVQQIHAFIRAAKEAQRLFEAGAARDEIAQRVSAEGKTKFWDHWWK